MLAQNLTEIKKRIATAAIRAGRSPADIKLVAVSKRISPEKIIEAIALGHTVFGENYVQDALEKIRWVCQEIFPGGLIHTGRVAGAEFIDGAVPAGPTAHLPVDGVSEITKG